MATAFLFPTTTTVQQPTSHGKQGAADVVYVTDDDRWMTFPRFPFSITHHFFWDGAFDCYLCGLGGLYRLPSSGWRFSFQ